MKDVYNHALKSWLHGLSRCVYRHPIYFYRRNKSIILNINNLHCIIIILNITLVIVTIYYYNN